MLLGKGAVLAAIAGWATQRVRADGGGLRQLAASLDVRFALAAVVIALPAALGLATLRWWVLLRAADVPIGFGQAARLQAVAYAANAFLPGGTGGDVVKIAGGARTQGRGAEVAATVLADRVIGLASLVCIALASVLSRSTAHGELATRAALGLVVAFALASAYASRGLRARVPIERMLSRLPAGELLRRVDGAAVALLRRPGALALAFAVSLVHQAGDIGAFALAGRAIGLDAPGWADWCRIVPLAFVANALPVSLGGLGLMEGALVVLLGDAHLGTATQAVALGVAVRALQAINAVPGGLVALLDRRLGRRAPEADQPEVAREGDGTT